MIVVDANIILYCFSETPMTAAAREVRRRDPDWVAPALWRFEVLNALAVLVRSGITSPDEATRIFAQAADVLRSSEREVDGRRVLALSGQLRITGYDAAYVELATRLGADLITEDRALLRSAMSTARSMADFLGASGEPIVREPGTSYSAPRRIRPRRSRAKRS